MKKYVCVCVCVCVCVYSDPNSAKALLNNQYKRCMPIFLKINIRNHFFTFPGSEHCEPKAASARGQSRF